MHQSKVAIRDLNRRMGFSPQLPHRFNYFRHTASIGRVIVAQPSAIGIYWKFSNPGNQITVGDKGPALTLFTESQILKLYDNSNRETVVERRVFYISRDDTRLLECNLARADSCRRCYIDSSSSESLD